MKKQLRNNIIFNIYSGGVNSIQSVIWVGIITRVLGLTDAGIFTFAYACGCLFLHIGYYGMRNFQVSDMSNVYYWREYHMSRVISTIAMILVSGIYCIAMFIFYDYTWHKIGVIIGMTLIKATDAYEDIYHGFYQKEGRLDIAGFCMGSRLCIQLLFLSLNIILFRNILYATMITAACSWILVFVFIWLGNKNFDFSLNQFRIGYLKQLLWTCAPLFFSSFIMFFLTNIPKYVIDILMTEADQAYYGFLSMPVFVVYLLSNYIYMPMMKDIAEAYEQKDFKRFLKLGLIAFSLITGVSLIVLCIGWSWGIFGLNLLYGVNLEQYKQIFMILLIGSVLYAYLTYFSVIITVMRKQGYLMIVNFLTVISAIIYTYHLVLRQGITGAGLSYLITMGVVAIVYLIFIIIQIYKRTEDIRVNQA